MTKHSSIVPLVTTTFPDDGVPQRTLGIRKVLFSGRKLPKERSHNMLGTTYTCSFVCFYYVSNSMATLSITGYITIV